MEATTTGPAVSDLVRELGPAAGGATRRQRAELAAARFEQIFVQQMVKALRDSASGLGTEGMFGSGPGSGTYADWFDSHLARHLSETGGIGLGKALLRSWQRDGSLGDAPVEGGTDVRA